MHVADISLQATDTGRLKASALGHVVDLSGVANPPISITMAVSPLHQKNDTRDYPRPPPGVENKGQTSLEGGSFFTPRCS